MGRRNPRPRLAFRAVCVLYGTKESELEPTNLETSTNPKTQEKNPKTAAICMMGVLELRNNTDGEDAEDDCELILVIQGNLEYHTAEEWQKTLLL